MKRIGIYLIIALLTFLIGINLEALTRPSNPSCETITGYEPLKKSPYPPNYGEAHGRGH